MAARSINWETDPDDMLYSVSDLRRTPLSRISQRTWYRLIQAGELPAVTVGRRLYLKRGTIRAYLRRCETVPTADPNS